MVFIGADWKEQWDYFDWAVKLTRTKGCFYVHNVVRELLSSSATDATKESLVTKVGGMGE
jgi:predicted O-methyltransferase YrrM